MEARRLAKDAKSIWHRSAETEAHRAIEKAKDGLGRAQVWWRDGAADLNRSALKNTPYVTRRPSKKLDSLLPVFGAFDEIAIEAGGTFGVRPAATHAPGHQLRLGRRPRPRPTRRI
jgi:hypothetical protein